MNKKLIMTIAIIVIIVFGGLSFGIYKYKENTTNKLINTSMTYIDKGEYNKAIATLDVILEQNQNDKATQLKDLVNNYLDADKSYTDHNLDGAIKDLDNMKDYSQFTKLNQDVLNLKQKIELDLKQEQEMEDGLTNVKVLLTDGKYQQSKDALAKLDQDKMTNEQKKEANELNSKLDEEIQKLEKEENDKKQKEQEAKQNQIPESQSPVFGEKTPWSKDGYTSYKGIRLPLPNGDPTQISGKLLNQICKLPMDEAFQILKNYGWSDKGAYETIYEYQNGIN